MSHLPECRITLSNKPFKFCGLDKFGPYLFREGRSTRKAWILLFTCLCSRCLHVKVVTSLDLDSFLLAFSRFMSSRGSVDTVYPDNTSSFRAAATDRLPDLLGSTEFQNMLCKSGTNWVRIPGYAPSQGGGWEVIVKLFKSALNKTVDTTRRMPLLIEFQTFFVDALRFVNHRPIITISDQTNDLAPITPSSFSGQHLSPNTPICGFKSFGAIQLEQSFLDGFPG